MDQLVSLLHLTNETPNVLPTGLSPTAHIGIGASDCICNVCQCNCDCNACWCTVCACK